MDLHPNKIFLFLGVTFLYTQTSIFDCNKVFSCLYPNPPSFVLSSYTHPINRPLCFSQASFAFKPRLTDACLIRTPRYYGQLAFSLGKAVPYIFSKQNSTRLIRTLSLAPLVSVLRRENVSKKYVLLTRPKLHQHFRRPQLCN